MSEGRVVTYQCPYCGTEFEVSVYDTVNAEMEPELRERVISGDLFRLSCPHCKKDFMIQYPLVYIDAPRKFVIWLSTEDAGEMLRDYTAPLIRQGYRLRRCETLRDLSEKIQIFEDGVDDVMVELAKYDCFIEFIDNKKGNPEDVTSLEYQRTENTVMKINVRAGDKGMSFMIPISMMEEEMRQNPDRYKVDNASVPVINTDWIVSLFTEPQGQA